MIIELLVAALVILLAFVVGAGAPALIQKLRNPVVASLRELRRTWIISQRPMQVLIVEDNPDSRRALRRFLVHRDYDVADAENLRAGVKFLQTGRFDAIISDIALPDGTGYTLINEARRLGMNALGIAVSGYPYPSNVSEPGITGFDYHLTKPVNCEDLDSLLKRALPKS